MSEFQLNDRRVINAWAMYDWANSAYFLVISTAIFPIYYTSITHEIVSVLGAEISNSALYAYAVSFAYITVAALTPLLSGIADYSGRRMFFLKFFTLLGSLACVAMFFFSDAGKVGLGTTAFIISTMGAGGAIVFYNAYLPYIATADRFDQVSARGYAYGYIGSVILLLFCLVMINKPDLFGFADAGLPTRIAFVLVGAWWIGFAQITFSRLPPDRPNETRGLVSRGFRELAATWNKVKKQPQVQRFLISFLFYMAGVQTVIYLATIFASKELGMETAQLILIVLILQLVAIAGAYLFAKVSSRVGNKTSLMIQITIWMLICLGAYFVTTTFQFFVVAGFVGLVLGGIQALSRATYAKLIEETEEGLASYFSFYDVLMKISLVGGSLIFGLVEQLTGGMRNSVLVLMVLFMAGLIVMWPLQVKVAAHGK